MEKEEPKKPLQLTDSEIIGKLNKIMALINKITRDKGYFKRGFGWQYMYSTMEDDVITITVSLYYYSNYFGGNAKLCQMSLRIDNSRIKKISMDYVRGYWATTTMTKYSKQLKDLREDICSLNIKHIFKEERERKWR